jgi:hypothetical protein
MNRWRSALFATLALAPLTAAPAPAPRPERWSGVDEQVVERVASEGGHTRWRNFLDRSGDLPLFVFTLAGFASGFVIGYGYRAIFSRPDDRRRNHP